MMIYHFPAPGSLTAACASGAHEPSCKFIETCACACHAEWDRFRVFQRLANEVERKIEYFAEAVRRDGAGAAMNLHDRINLANADARQEHKRRRIEYWEQLPQRKIGSRRDSYMDLMWVWLGLGAAILGIALAMRII